MDGIILPYRTDWREMAGVLEYAKGKGVDRSLLEARFGGGEGLRETLNALEQLRLIIREETSGDVRLTALGDRLAYAPDLDQRAGVLAEALLGYGPYRFPLERALDDRTDVLDALRVEHVWQVDMRLAQPRNRVEEARTLFFRLADHAGLGTYRRGVRGQTTRLELDADARSEIQRALETSAGVIGEDVAAAGPETGPGIEEAWSADSTADADREPASAYRPSQEYFPPRVTAGPATSMTVHVDLTEWDLDKIEAFLRLIGYIGPSDERPSA